MANQTYNCCRVCGYTPGKHDIEMNTNRRWWDPDDGWKIGAICRWCWNDAKDDKPEPGDFAYDETNQVADDVLTDDDPIEALMDQEGILAHYVRTGEFKNGRTD